MDIFSYKNYKSFLKEEIQQQGKTKGFQSRMAEAAGCQASYLSKALNSHVHLTIDHIYGICQYLKLSEDQTDYLIELLNFERAASKGLRLRCEERMEKIRKRNLQISTRASGPNLPLTANKMTYYSSWIYAAIYVTASIPDYDSPAKIAKKLNLNVDQVRQGLSVLKKLNLVDKSNGHWEITQQSIHLPRDSPLNNLNHQNWRNLAGIDIQKGNESSIHYTAVHSLSYEDFEVLKKKILDFIQESHQLVKNSNEEEIINLCIDCFVP